MKKVFMVVILILALVFGCVPPDGDNMAGLSPLAVEFSTVGHAVDYGVLPRVANHSKRSIVAWINLSDGVTGAENTNIIAGMYTDTGGAAFYIGIASDNRFRLGQGYSVARGNWQTGVNTVSVGQWVFVAGTLDASSDANDPILYINSVSTAFTENLTPSGLQASETGVSFLLGNIKTAARDYIDPINGKIFDVRIYDRILTQAEVTAIYNGGTPSMSAGTKSGLIFQPFAVRTEKLANYVNQNLNGLKLFDAQFLATGTVIGNVTGRAAP